MTGLASAVGRYLSGTSSAASAFSPKSSRARPALPARPMTTGAARIPVMLVVVQEAGERAWRVGGGLKRAQCPAHRSQIVPIGACRGAEGAGTFGGAASSRRIRCMFTLRYKDAARCSPGRGVHA